MLWKRLPVPLLCILLLLFVGVVVHAQTTQPQPQPNAAGLLPEFNRWRTAIGIHPYQEDIRLSTSAQFHTDDMIARNHYEHVSPSPVECNGVPVTQPGERAACFGTWDRGEGLTVGHTDPASATRGWISSYGHCTGVMNSTATHMGGGHTTSTNPDFNIWDEAWAFQFNGVTDASPINHEAFCGCTSGKNTESDIQACVVQFNNQFNNGVAPVPASIPQIERPLRRFPDNPRNPNETYNNTNSGGICCFSFFPGVVTLRVVPVTGSASGITLELATDGRGFPKIPGATGTDSVTYTLTQPTSLAVWFNSANLPAGDTFYIEAEWNPIGGEPAAPTTAPVATDAVTTQGCALSAADATQLSAAIQQANDEAQCPGPDTIRLTNTLQPAAGHDGGDTAFPPVTSTIIIDGMNAGAPNFAITRDPSAPAFRFFFVDGTNGNAGHLTLQNIALRGGDAGASLDGGAVFVDARNGGQAAITIEKAEFTGNVGSGNGGALLTLSLNGGQVDTVIRNSFFVSNSGVYGGAFYNGGFDGGNATALIVDTVFTGNTASAEGGAIYNNGLGQNGNAQMTVENSHFTINSAPTAGAIMNNGRASGNAGLIIHGGSFSDNSASGPGDAIFNLGDTGTTAVNLPDGSSAGIGAFGEGLNVCISDDTGALAEIQCP